MPASSLNVHVTWDRVSKLLDLPKGGDNLPAISVCPLCGGKMKIYLDEQFKGHYYHCHDCKSHGDLIKLLEEKWEVSTETILEMLTLGNVLDPAIATPKVKKQYVKRCRGYFTQAADLWATAQQYLAARDDTHLEWLMNLHRLQFESRDLKRWLNGPGRLLGGSSRRLIDSTFYPCSISTTNGIFTSKGCLFRGRGWGPLLIIPLYTFPNRIQSLVMLGREGRIMHDVVFKNIYRHEHLKPGSSSKPSDAGMVAGNLIPDCRSDRVVITPEWLFVLQMHMKNFRLSNVPLPFAAWWDYNRIRTTSLDALDGRRAVIWARKITTGVIEQAMRGDLDISMAQPTGDMYSKQGIDWIHRTPGRKMMDLMHRTAKPWRIQVQRWFKTYPELLNEAIVDWKSRNMDVDLILCEAKLRKQSGVGHRLECQIHNGILRERTGTGWEYKVPRRNWLRICNGVVRITQIIYDKELDTTFYKGSVRMNSQRAHFIVDQKTANNGKEFCLFIQQLTAANQLGSFQFKPAYKGRLLAYALALYTPRCTTGPIQTFVKRLQNKNVKSGLY